MNKNLFVNIITALQEQYDDDLAKAYILGKVLDYEANPYDNSKLSNAIFRLLRLYFKDKTDDIEIFCWEHNFGRMNDVSIEKLWDFLQKPTRMKNNWDDEENDAKYSASSTLIDEIGHYCDPSSVNWHLKKDLTYKTVVGVNGNIYHYTEWDLLKDPKDIEVKDFVIVSPLKKR